MLCLHWTSVYWVQPTAHHKGIQGWLELEFVSCIAMHWERPGAADSVFAAWKAKALYSMLSSLAALKHNWLKFGARPHNLTHTLARSFSRTAVAHHSLLRQGPMEFSLWQSFWNVSTLPDHENMKRPMEMEFHWDPAAKVLRSNYDGLYWTLYSTCFSTISTMIPWFLRLDGSNISSSSWLRKGASCSMLSVNDVNVRRCLKDIWWILPLGYKML